MRSLPWFLSLTLHLAVACLPTVLLSVFIQPDASLAWLVVLAMIPVGPAIAAGLHAVRSRESDPELPAARAFWRGYRLTGREALTVAAPTTLVVGAIALVLMGGGDAGIPAMYRGVLLGFGVLLVIGTLHALALAAAFRFPLADLVQLAAYSLVRRWGASLGLLALVGGAIAITSLLSDLALVALAGLWVWLCHRVVAPSLHDIHDRFTSPDRNRENPT